MPQLIMIFFPQYHPTLVQNTHKQSQREPNLLSSWLPDSGLFLKPVILKPKTMPASHFQTNYYLLKTMMKKDDMVQEGSNKKHSGEDNQKSMCQLQFPAFTLSLKMMGGFTFWRRILKIVVPFKEERLIEQTVH